MEVKEVGGHEAGTVLSLLMPVRRQMLKEQAAAVLLLCLSLLVSGVSPPLPATLQPQRTSLCLFLP